MIAGDEFYDDDVTSGVECPGYWCPGQHGGDHDHSPVPFVGSWMPQEAYAPLPDHPANSRYQPAVFVETWQEDAEGWVTTPLDYMRQGDCE